MLSLASLQDTVGQNWHRIASIMIDIRLLSQLNPDDLYRLVTGYTSDAKYQVSVTESAQQFVLALGQKGTARFPKDFKYFEWNQTRLICIPGDIKSKLVGPGRYRISSTFVNVKEELKGKPEEFKRTFYSDEFMIK